MSVKKCLLLINFISFRFCLREKKTQNLKAGSAFLYASFLMSNTHLTWFENLITNKTKTTIKRKIENGKLRQTVVHFKGFNSRTDKQMDVKITWLEARKEIELIFELYYQPKRFEVNKNMFFLFFYIEVVFGFKSI